MLLSQTEIAFQTARGNMVLGQLVPNRIHETEILDAMGAVPREKFLPPRLQGRAYADESILIQRNCFLFEPLVTARLLQLAAVKKTDFVLNLKAATGYTAALLARMSMAVVALESDSGLCDAAQERFIEMEIDNAAVLNTNPEAGFPSQAPYNLIFIDGVVPNIPETLTDQLAEGGSLVCVTVKPFSLEGKATKVSKNNGVLSYLNAFDVALDDFIRPRTYKNFIFESVS